MGTLLAVQTIGGAVLFAGAWLAALALRRRSAATRALIWSCTVGAVLVLPLLAAVLPHVEVPVLPAAVARVADTSQSSVPPVDPAEALSSDARQVAPPLADPGASSVDSARAASVRSGSGTMPNSASRPALAESASPQQFRWPSISLGMLAVAVWIAGALLLLTQLLVGIVRVRGVERRAVAVRDPALKRAFASAMHRLRLKGHVDLLETDELPVPATWHCRRPCVLVPRGMASWSHERQEAVLLHELAHVRRNDGRLQLLAWIVVALHWLDPFCWVALASLRREREQACDDAVLDAGVRPSAYATHLLEIARSSGADAPAFLPAMSLLNGPALGGRVRAILDPLTGRRSPDRSTTVSVISLTLLLTLPLAAFQPVAAQEAPVAPSPPAVAPGPLAGIPPATAPEAPPAAGPEMLPAVAPRAATAAPVAAQEPRPSIDELVQMRIHGITPEYVEEMTEFLGRSLPVEELVTLKIHGTTPEFGREMAAIVGSLDADDLVRMRIHGVTPELARDLEQAFGDLDVDQLVNTRIHGLTPEYAREMKALLGQDLQVSDLVQMRIQGLSTEDARKLQELLPDETLDADDLVSMRIHGVTPKLVEDLRAVGYTDLTADELIKIRIHGLDRVMLRKDGGQ